MNSGHGVSYTGVEPVTYQGINSRALYLFSYYDIIGSEYGICTHGGVTLTCLANKRIKPLYQLTVMADIQTRVI